MTEYPRDQFDDVPEYRDRKGSHRALSGPSRGSGPSGLTWISLAAALALVIGAFSFFILPTLRAGDSSGPGAGPGGAAATAPASVPGAATPGQGVSSGPSGSPEPAASAEPPVTAEPTATPDGTESSEPAESPESTESPEPTESPEETEEPATVDYSLPVEVYNSSRVGGLAGRVSGALSGSGFTVATAGNWSGFPVSSSAVFYSSNEVTAQAVAARLGLPVVYDGRVPGIAVVVTAAYAG